MQQGYHLPSGPEEWVHCGRICWCWDFSLFSHPSVVNCLTSTRASRRRRWIWACPHTKGRDLEQVVKTSAQVEKGMLTSTFGHTSGCIPSGVSEWEGGSVQLLRSWEKESVPGKMNKQPPGDGQVCFCCHHFHVTGLLPWLSFIAWAWQPAGHKNTLCAVLCCQTRERKAEQPRCSYA